MSTQISGMLGSAGTTQTALDTQYGAQAPTIPGSAARTGQSGILGAGAGALDTMRSFAMKLGKTPEEREKNAKAFAALVKDVGSMASTMSESSLMQRMMEHSMSGPTFLDTGTAPSGGVASIPKTFDPSVASHIVNQMGYK